MVHSPLPLSPISAFSFNQLRRTIIEAEVEGVGRGDEVRCQVLLGPINPHEEAGLFGAGQLLEPGDRAARDYQGVAGRDGEFVGDRQVSQTLDGDKARHYAVTQIADESNCSKRPARFGCR